MNKELLKIIKERGLLLERDVFELMSNLAEMGVVKALLEGIEEKSGQKIITKSLLNQHFSAVQEVVKSLSGEKQQEVKHVLVKLGISVQIISETKVREGKESEKVEREKEGSFQLHYAETKPDKKLEVKDFTGYFRSRYGQLQRILMARAELNQNLISIGKLSGERQQISIIGMVKEKRVTKNGNLIIGFEDLTGEVSALVKGDNKNLFGLAEELQLDDVVGVRASGNRDLLFIYEIFFPDAFLMQKTLFEEDVCVAFVSDLHCGSKMHLKENFEKFLEWLNSEDNTAKKIKYIFFLGDNVDGVGVFPGQEDVLSLKSMEEQYGLLASYLRKIPRKITMFMCPGQHDACRVAEPQPLISKKYASALYDMENLVLVTNPCLVKLIEKNKEFKVLMYHGASIHAFINEIKELRLMKAHKYPARVVKYLLKRRHLSPTHGSAAGVYIPYFDNDPLVISEVPDVMCTGEVHKLDIENYHGVLVVTSSCWQSKTPFEEKVGNEPDPCKVPVLNLKTREVKIFDFSDEKNQKEAREEKNE